MSTANVKGVSLGHVQQWSWQHLQLRVFKNWMNDRLATQTQVKDLETDLKDGLLLIDLLNKLHPKAIERYNNNPQGKLQCIENLGLALRFCTNQGIKLVNIGPEDIYGGNLKLILGLIWTLIDKYQIQNSGKSMSTKKAMLGWIATVIPEYHITNFNTDWNDGRALCGMVDHIRPGLCPNHYALDDSQDLKNCQLGMDLAEQHLNIPKVLSPEDLNNPEVDDLSVMTYLSYFCNPANAQLLQWIRKKIPQRNIMNLNTDWNNGVNLAAYTEACFPGICPDWEKMDPANGLQNNERMIQLIKKRLWLQCPVNARELSNPKVDEIVVATYLSQLCNATQQLHVSPKEKNGCRQATTVKTDSRAATGVRPPFTPRVFGFDLSELNIKKDKKLGKGGFGDVYEGNSKIISGMTLAVKVIPLHGSATFPQEITVLHSLPQHRNIITFFGVATDDFNMFIVTELAVNGSLFDYLHMGNNTPSDSQSLAWASDIAQGMKHLHDHDVIHRDLKSANVLLTSGWVAKLCDFGSARELARTVTTEQTGTFRWMSPEIMMAACGRVNKKCDLFSYGMVLFELFAHEIPYADLDDDIDVLLSIREGKRPPIPATLPPYLHDLLKSCWEKEPHLRPSFDDFVTVLTSNTASVQTPKE